MTDKPPTREAVCAAYADSHDHPWSEVAGTVRIVLDVLELAGLAPWLAPAPTQKPAAGREEQAKALTDLLFRLPALNLDWMQASTVADVALDWCRRHSAPHQEPPAPPPPEARPEDRERLLDLAVAAFDGYGKGPRGSLAAVVDAVAAAVSKPLLTRLRIAEGGLAVAKRDLAYLQESYDRLHSEAKRLERERDEARAALAAVPAALRSAAHTGDPAC